MKRIPRTGRLFMAFEAGTLAGIWRWLARSQARRPRVGYYVDRHDAPGARPIRRVIATWMYRCETDGEMVDAADISDDGHHLTGIERVMCVGFVHLIKVQP
jgi:hypothetical protein